MYHQMYGKCTSINTGHSRGAARRGANHSVYTMYRAEQTRRDEARRSPNFRFVNAHIVEQLQSKYASRRDALTAAAASSKTGSGSALSRKDGGAGSGSGDSISDGATTQGTDAKRSAAHTRNITIHAQQKERREERRGEKRCIALRCTAQHSTAHIPHY